MSRVLIPHYLNDLATLRQVGGAHRESVVREAFKDLLRGWARSHELVFVPEYGIESPAKECRHVGGAPLHALRMPFGYWEAKDDKDDLDAEIALKFKRSCPHDNIIFEDSTQAVLIQDTREVMRCPIDDVDQLERLLTLFFGYQRPEIAAFHKVAQHFLDHGRETINPSVPGEDVRAILIQHIPTDEVFGKVFPGQPFHKDDNVARELHELEDTLPHRQYPFPVAEKYKEKKPKDPTIRAKFDSYRFADHQDTVIDLLARVTRVSVETQAIVAAMREAAR